MLVNSFCVVVSKQFVQKLYIFPLKKYNGMIVILDRSDRRITVKTHISSTETL